MRVEFTAREKDVGSRLGNGMSVRDSGLGTRCFL